MSNLAKLLAQPPVAANQCKICYLLVDHPEAAVIRKALTDERWSAPALARVLTAEGFPVGESSVKRHRSDPRCKQRS